MSEKKAGTVTLIAPNGQTVSVDAAKQAERVAAGYRLPEKPAPTKGRPAQPVHD